ncbi:MAG: hypothetical protein ACLURP_09790 [Ruminococcus sp.]
MFPAYGIFRYGFLESKEAGISNSQLYKQAGNSIVVDVLYYIFLELYKAMPYLFEDIRLSSFFSGIGAFEKALERLEEQVNQ